MILFGKEVDVEKVNRCQELTISKFETCQQTRALFNLSLKCFHLTAFETLEILDFSGFSRRNTWSDA